MSFRFTALTERDVRYAVRPYELTRRRFDRFLKRMQENLGTDAQIRLGDDFDVLWQIVECSQFFHAWGGLPRPSLQEAPPERLNRLIKAGHLITRELTIGSDTSVSTVFAISPQTAILVVNH